MEERLLMGSGPKRRAGQSSDCDCFMHAHASCSPFLDVPTCLTPLRHRRPPRLRTRRCMTKPCTMSRRVAAQCLNMPFPCSLVLDCASLLINHCGGIPLQATATASKAQFDKFVLDKAEEKAAFDAVLEHAEATAAQQKAIADKALVDFGELQVRGVGSPRNGACTSLDR
jgi:hypothetical protein